MQQYCPTCGMEMTFYYQNQRWYCHTCQRYAQPIQQQVQSAYPQPGTGPQPAPPPPYVPVHDARQVPVMDEELARSKILGGIRMRGSTDRIVSTRWAFMILLFQLIVPILTFSMLYLVLMGTSITLSNTAQVLLIIAVFLTAVVMVILMSVLAYKLVGRRDEHFRRDVLLKQGMVEYLDALSVKERRDINVERWNMSTMFQSDVKGDRGPGLWALLVALIGIIPIIGVFATLYCLHFLTKDVHHHASQQNRFNHQFQLGMMKLGRMDTMNYDPAPMPRRDTGAYILLSILTLGFFLPYWWYVNIVDMNTHMRNQWQFEAGLLKVIGPEENIPGPATEAADEVSPEP